MPRNELSEEDLSRLGSDKVLEDLIKQQTGQGLVPQSAKVINIPNEYMPVYKLEIIYAQK